MCKGYELSMHRKKNPNIQHNMQCVGSPAIKRKKEREILMKCISPVNLGVNKRTSGDKCVCKRHTHTILKGGKGIN